MKKVTDHCSDARLIIDQPGQGRRRHARKKNTVFFNLIADFEVWPQEQSKSDRKLLCNKEPSFQIRRGTVSDALQAS